MKKTVGMRIKEAREEKGVSKVELAKQTGVSYNMLIKYENDDAEPGLYYAAKIAEALDVSLDWIARGFK